MKKTIIAASLLAASVSSISFAEGTSLKGLYIDGSVGTNFAVYHINNYHDAAFSKAGVNLNVGYMLNNYLAPEVGYTYYGIGMQGLDVALKAMLPFNVGTYGMNVFGKVGAEHVYNNNAGETYPLLGVGVGVGVSRNVDWTFQAQTVVNNFGSNFTSAGLLSTGLIYKFD